MKGRWLVVITLGVALVFVLLFARSFYKFQDVPREQFVTKKMRVLTYSSFVGPGGPGGHLIKAFKKMCNCEIDLQTAGDAGLILERLKLLRDSQPVDVIFGIDQMTMPLAEEMKWRPLVIDVSNFSTLPRSYVRNGFIPIDWSPMSFVYRDGEIEPPKTFADLTSPKFKGQIALQDPRSSSPGLQFFNWVRSVKGVETERFLSQIKPNVASVSPSWSMAYGLFRKDQAKMAFSYVTSLAYHWDIDKDRRYKIAEFKEGHPVQVEYAAVPADCTQCELGEQFIQFMLQAEPQKLIMQRNFMFPVLKGVTDGTVYSELPTLTERSTPAGRELKEWQAVFQ